MKLGDKITALRKEKGLNREDLGKKVGTSGAVIGRYERNEITPSVEIANKIAEALSVSLDYLVGNTDTFMDKSIMKRIQSIQKLSSEDKKHVFAMLDAFLFKSNVQHSLNS